MFPRGAALWAFLLASLGSVAGQPLGAEPMCTAQPLARYSITFTGKWSQASFPKQYPLFRPPAQWSSLLGECSPGPVSGAPRGDRRAGCSAEVHTAQFGRHPHRSLQCKRRLLRSSMRQQLRPAFRDVGGQDHIARRQGGGLDGVPGLVLTHSGRWCPPGCRV